MAEERENNPYYKNSYNKSVNNWCCHCWFQVINKFETNLIGISGLLRGCPNNSDTDLFYQDSHKDCDNNCYITTASVLLKQPCNKSDSPIKLVTSC